MRSFSRSQTCIMIQIQSHLCDYSDSFIEFMIIMMNKCCVTRVINVKGAFLKGKFASEDEKLMLEVPQGFCWVYDKLGDEVEPQQKCRKAMLSEEVMKRAKAIFGEWIAKPFGEKLQLQQQQLNIKQGSKKVYLMMEQTIHGRMQDGATEGISRHGLHQKCG
jgi:hypothetical protein